MRVWGGLIIVVLALTVLLLILIGKERAEESSTLRVHPLIIDMESHNVTLEEFAAFFLNSIKAQADELIRSSTSTCNTPQKSELSRKGSLQQPSDVATSQPTGADAPAAPAESDGSPFCDSYDMATLREKSQLVADSSFVQNKSMRRLFPTSDSLNQSSDFESSSLRQHASDSGTGLVGGAAEETPTTRRGGKTYRSQRNTSADLRNLRNQSNLFTSTPIRNANMEVSTPPPSTGDGRRGPSLTSTPLNHTFPQRHQTATNPPHPMTNNAQQQPDSGCRKQANRTISSLGEFMGRPKCAIQFPPLGHNNNNYPNNRRKTQQSAAAAGQNQQPHLDSPLFGSGRSSPAPTRLVDTSDEKSNSQGTTATKKQKPKRRVVPISLSTSTTAGGVRNRDSASSSTMFVSSSSTASTAAVANSSSFFSGGKPGGGGNRQQNGFGNEFMSSSFHTANNLLNVQGEEYDQPAAAHGLHERRLLREEKEAIQTDFDEEANRGPKNLRKAVAHLLASSSTSSAATTKSDCVVGADNAKGSPKAPKMKLEHVMRDIKDKKRLDVCVEIYSTILNYNLTMNLLSELTFLLTIINVVGVANMTSGGEAVPTVKMRQLSVGETAEAQTPPAGETDAEPATTMMTDGADFEVLFRVPLNCIYLAVGVLNKQRGKLLALLDAKTLRILIENERLGVLSAGLITYLQDVYRLKGELEQRYRAEYDGFRAGTSLAHDEHGGQRPPSQQSVFYQVEDDTRDNFPTQTEFVAFKKQRDLFYVILRSWEERHLHVGWDFEQQLGSRIRYLFVLMPHPINMAHLAKLFTRQLLVCCNHWNNVEQSAAQTELLERFANVDLNRLSKLEQRLVTPGHFSAELLFPGIQVFFKEFIVAAESNPAFMEQLKIALLAELLALNDSTYEILNVTTTTTAGPAVVQFNEIVVGPASMSIMRVLAKFLGFVVSQPFQYEGNRNKTVDNKQVELRNLQLPQFDVVAVLETALKKDKLLITVPWMVQYLAMLDAVTLQLDYYRKLLKTLYRLYVDLPYQKVSPASSLVLRLCLGWLFERANVSATSWYYQADQDTGARDMNKVATATVGNPSDGKAIAAMLHPLLEKILPVACPFLADFRLTIFPLWQNQKLVSRTTGRYRHIATTQLPFTNPKEASGGRNIESPSPHSALIPTSQSRLIEAFLQSQSPSLRKIIDFLIERVSSTTIKDFQIQHFLAIKKDAQSATKEIKLTEKKAVISRLMSIYTKALEDLTHRWTSTVPGAIEAKVKECIGALMPMETISAVKDTCTDIVIRMCLGKTNDWRVANFNQIDIFSKDIESEALTIVRARQSAAGATEVDDQMVISIDHAYPSSVYHDLQMGVHLTSMFPGQMTKDVLGSLLDKLLECFTFNSFSTATLRSFLVIVNNLFILNIAQSPDIVYGVLDKLRNVLNVIKDTNQLGFPSRTRDGRTKASKNIFPGSILPRCLLFYFDPENRTSLEVLSAYLRIMLDLNFLCTDSLNKDLVALLRFDWPAETYKTLTLLTAAIRDLEPDNDDDEGNDKSQLLLGALANLTAHIEDFNEFDEE